MKQNPAIVIMAKTPQVGLVKTRLQSVLSRRQCVEIAICFLLDAVRKSLLATENVFVAFSPADSEDRMKNLLPDETELILQEGNDLGERMQSAFLSVEKKGFSPVIMIGTDSPTLPPECLKEAVTVFSETDTKVVLGRTVDGGYYLIGLKNWKAGLFETVEWSSAKTFSDTFINAKKIFGEEPVQILLWTDVDTPDDFAALVKEFSENKDFRDIAPATAQWLESYCKKLSRNDLERIG